ncbi:DegV family protein [Halalkalibacter hemicellulosilyticus]|uniref:DegV family protein n=1 Tax=Halalkalibacter hemicellulosilyticusJCM 9152 TaxID=1236971 RepID=W4QBY9_9BACI|nr:DegV family protein [Halalkalibacter hemicellulosilyticus]GAE29203.1 DegV family protein [Halalkalibacter hemicellulosilyticusJCM 9152]
MSTIKIVTDSTADIPNTLAEELGITVVPLNVIFSDEEVYEDGVTLTADRFYEYVKERNVIPSTSQPTPYQFEELYRSLSDEDTEIISIHLSSKLSGTYQAATIAKQALEMDSIHVIDSKRASYAIGIIVVEIAKYAKSGKSLEDCLSRLEELLNDTTVYFMVDTLEYLQKNGRIGKASALLGSMLKIKPILSLNEAGEVYSFEKARGQKKALNRILEVFDEQFGREPVHVGISHAVNEQYARDVLSLCQQRFNVQSDVITSIGAVIGAHVGPGTIAISITRAKNEVVE